MFQVDKINVKVGGAVEVRSRSGMGRLTQHVAGVEDVEILRTQEEWSVAAAVAEDGSCLAAPAARVHRLLTNAAICGLPLAGILRTTLSFTTGIW